MTDLIFNVQTYGAVGDGITDDKTAIDSTITAANVSGGVVFFPPGIYKITDIINLNNIHNVVVTGSLATINQVTATKHALRIYNGSADVTISGLRVTGPHTSQAAVGDGSGIIVGNYSSGDSGTTKQNILIEKCYVQGFKHAGIMIYGAQSGANNPTNKNIIIRNNSIKDCQNGVFVYKNGTNIIIDGNTIEDAWYDGIIIDAKSVSDGEVAKPNQNINITNNTVRGTGTYGQAVGILAKGENKSVAITGNTILDTGLVQTEASVNSYGINIQQEASANPGLDYTVTGNTITNMEANSIAFGIYIAECYNITVTGNSISNIQHYGIYTYKIKNATLAGNTILRCGSVSIVAQGISGTPSLNLTIIANTCMKDTGAGITGISTDWASGVAVTGNACTDMSTKVSIGANTVNYSSTANV